MFFDISNGNKRGTAGLTDGTRARLFEGPPLPSPLLPVFPDGHHEEREEDFFAFVPRVARSSQPWANGRNPFGVLRFRGSMHQISVRRNLTPPSPLGRRRNRLAGWNVSKLRMQFPRSSWSVDGCVRRGRRTRHARARVLPIWVSSIVVAF